MGKLYNIKSTKKVAHFKVFKTQLPFPTYSRKTKVLFGIYIYTHVIF